MAAVSTIIAGAALAVGAASGYASYKQGKKAQEATEIQEDLQRAQTNSTAVTQSRETVRKGRISRARAMQGGYNSGISGSSTTSGLASDSLSRTGGTLSDISNANQISNRNIDYAHTVGSAKTRQANALSVGRLSGSVFNAAGGWNTMQTAYNKSMGKSNPESINTVAEIKGGQHDSSIFK